MIAGLKVNRVQRHAVQSRWPAALCPGVAGCWNTVQCLLITAQAPGSVWCRQQVWGGLVGKPHRGAC
jgi:hypothetical protein